MPVLDDYFLLLTLIITAAQQLLFYCCAAGLKIDKVTDFAYGTNFILLALVCLFVGDYYAPRQVILASCVAIWGIRLAGYLLVRILRIGNDKRFDEYRESKIKFGVFWLIQFIIVWVTFLQVAFALSCVSDACNPPFRWNDYMGFAFFLIGFACETVADQQKYEYRNDESNKDHWCDVGIWSWSRHPNYFGEILLWWGIFSVCTSTFLHDWMYVSILGPLILTMSIFFVTGLTKLEESADKRYWHRSDYQLYRKRTSLFVPMPPALYEALPSVVQCGVCCEWPLYRNPSAAEEVIQQVAEEGEGEVKAEVEQVKKKSRRKKKSKESA